MSLLLRQRTGIGELESLRRLLVPLALMSSLHAVSCGEGPAPGTPAPPPPTSPAPAPPPPAVTEPTEVRLSVSPTSLAEDAGVTELRVTGTLVGGTRTAATEITLRVVAGTAEPADFAATGAVLTIPAGEASGAGSVVLTPVHDALAEPRESIRVEGTAAGLTVVAAEVAIVDTPQVTEVGEGVSTTSDGRILLELRPEDTEPANLFDLNGKTLVFTPNGSGGYSRDVRSLEWEETLGTDVSLEWDRLRDGIEVKFGGFEFGFASRRWNSVFMSRHGFLTFGAPLEWNYRPWFSPMSESAVWLATTSTISALYKPAFGGHGGLDPLASQFVAHFPDRVVFTWFASEYDAHRVDVPDHAERFQAILYADGAIQFNYGRITVGDGVVGLFSDAAVVPGRVLAGIVDEREPRVRRYLDLLEATIYGTDGDAVIVEFTVRGPIPQPRGATKILYRVYVDTDPPYWTGEHFEDSDLTWKIWVDDGGYHGQVLPREAENRIAMLVEIGDLGGSRVSVIAQAAEFDADGSVLNNTAEPLAFTLPSVTPTDLSEPDRGSSPTQSEVFHYQGEPDVGALACRIIENLGDRFDLFVWHNEFRLDFQVNSSDWRNYYNGVGGIGRKDTWRGAPCGDGRLLGHYEQVIRIWHTGGRSHELEKRELFRRFGGFTHELIHSWAAYLSYMRDDGTRGRLFADSFAESCGCHWRGALHAPAAFPWGGEEASSLMKGGEGGGFWRDNGDGTFTAIPFGSHFGEVSGLSWLDLYLMGLAEASEVPDTFLLRNPRPVAGNDSARYGGFYGTFHADKEIISIDQIVAAMGPREPPAARSRKEFNAGFVYLLEPGQMPDPDLFRLHRNYRDTEIEYWSHITGGRSEITTVVPGGASTGRRR